MMGMITDSHSPDSAVTAIKNHRPYGSTDFVSEVTTTVPYQWSGLLPGSKLPSRQRTILVDDYGLKYNILRSLRARGCVVTAMPANSSAQDFISRNPDGIVLSPGPGDPARLAGAISTAKELVGKIPILGICLGSQVIAHAFGGTTFKLKFGHRGSNHPVKDVRTDKVYITSQNHGYAVDPNSLPASLIVSHVNLNDGTVEGLRHASMPVMGIQYHSEASPGPLDSGYIFDDFLEMIDASS
jgi:carbamoyl-phosphate synthase small subunit